MEQEGKMTGMSVFRDEKAVKSSPKSEKSLKTQRNWRLSRTFLLSLHLEPNQTNYDTDL